MRCKVCDGAPDERFRVREMMLGEGDVFEYVRCTNCRCLMLVDIPKDISRYYPRNYYSFSTHLSAGRATGLKTTIKQLRNEYAVFSRGLAGQALYYYFPHEALRSLGHVPNLTRRSHILDVGCGAGSTLLALKGMGFQNVTGLDPFLEADIEYENGLIIRKQSLNHADGQWDLVMLHHSFEHMNDPAASLRKLTNLLAPGGTILIRIPTVPCYAWEHYGVDWVQLDAPRHYFIHSESSIRHLAEEHGMRLVNIVHDSTAFQFWGSEQYRNNIPLHSARSFAVSPRASMFSRSQIAQFTRQARRLNHAGRGDTAAYYLRAE